MTLPADLETMDLHTTATSPPTLRAAEPRRLRNDFEDFFGTRRPQLIRSAEIALPFLMSWDLLVVDKPAGGRSRCDKSTEQILAEITRPCPRCFVFTRRAGQGGCVHMTCGNPRCQHEFCWLCLQDWTSATHDASFCTSRAEASHSEVLASVERQIRSNWGATGARHAASGGHLCEGGISALPRGTHHTSWKMQMCPCVGDAS